MILTHWHLASASLLSIQILTHTTYLCQLPFIKGKGELSRTRGQSQASHMLSAHGPARALARPHAGIAPFYRVSRGAFFFFSREEDINVYKWKIKINKMKQSYTISVLYNNNNNSIYYYWWHRQALTTLCFQLQATFLLSRCPWHHCVFINECSPGVGCITTFVWLVCFGTGWYLPGFIFGLVTVCSVLLQMILLFLFFFRYDMKAIYLSTNEFYNIPATISFFLLMSVI